MHRLPQAPRAALPDPSRISREQKRKREEDHKKEKGGKDAKK